MENERASQVGGRGTLELLPQARERVVLASQSPRRAEILRAVGWPFEAEAGDVDETLRAGEQAARYVERLARAKAEAVAARRLFGLVLGADTVVVVDGEVLGKPRDEAEARRMLRRLRGRWHEVLTGVALARAETKQSVTAHERTRVRFAPMTDAEVDWYVATGEPA
ncbi:MAG TPA: Maf family protein, partial [Pyrinomonadaceae bacterium]